MGFRFRRSIKIIPGIRLNISKSGVSTSIGGRGGSINIGPRGTRGTVGIPGTGLSYSEKLSADEHREDAAEPQEARRANYQWVLWLVLGVLVLVYLARQ